MSIFARKLRRKKQKPEQTQTPAVTVAPRDTELDRLAIQRAVENPSRENLTPKVVNLIQRQYGNQFTADLVQRAQAETIVQRAIEYEPTGLPKMDTMFNDCVNENYNLIKNLWQNATSRLYNEDPEFSKAMAKTDYKKAWAVQESMRREIIKQAEKDFAPEVTNFMIAVENYKKDPSYEKATEIFHEFIEKNVAPQEINIRGGTRAAITNAIRIANSVQGRGRGQRVRVGGGNRGRGQGVY